MRRLLFLAKIAFTALLIALLAHAFDLRGLAGYLARLDAVTALAVLAVALAVLPLQTWRWMMVLDAGGAHLPFRRTLSIVLVGHFFNQTLPSTVGGDAMRMWFAYRAGLTPGHAAATVIFDRVISLGGLLLLTACSLPWLLELVPDPSARAAIMAVVAAGLTGFAAAAILAGFPGLVPDWRLARGFAARARRLLDSPLRLAAGLALSVAAFACFSYMVWLLARSLGLPLGLVPALLLVPPVLLVSVIPVSVAGWGLREGAMVLALGFVGIEPAAAVAVSVLFGIAIAVTSLPGAVLWLTSGDSARSAGQAAEFAASAARTADPPG
jgi:uncharacterized membrane protein YbhN (UPF0104 family)